MANNATNRLSSGFSSLLGGMDSGVAPSLVRANECAVSVNVTFRGAYPSTRPPFWHRPLTLVGTAIQNWTGIFQGYSRYDNGAGISGFVVSRGGCLFFIADTTWTVTEITPQSSVTTTGATVAIPAPGQPLASPISVSSVAPFSIGQVIWIDFGLFTVTTVDAVNYQLQLTYNSGGPGGFITPGTIIYQSDGVTQIKFSQPNPDALDFVCIFQAECFAIVLAGQNPTIIWDGSTAWQSGFDQLPPGYVGAYGWGRIWMCNPNRISFIAGDIVFGQSGTPAYGGRDAILKVTENTFLNEGGAFGIPANAGLMTSMQFLATQDSSLGVGALLVGTQNGIFSVNAPTDRTTWKNLTYPIQTVSLLGYGPMSQNGTVPINGDMWHRRLDGFSSFTVARRDFGMPGNSPNSNEITNLIENDDISLLPYGSGVYFDNRLLETLSPFRGQFGIHHRGVASIIFDSISNLSGNSAPAWEGAWTGVEFLGLTKGMINGIERGFAFVAGSEDIQLWELMADNEYTYDRFVTESGAIQSIPIQCSLVTRSEDYGAEQLLKTLYMGCLYADDIADTVTCTIKYKPDQYPDWIVWRTFSVCAANVSQCTINPTGQVGCSVWKPFARLYASRITLGQPNTLAAVSGMVLPLPPRFGHEFQFRIEWTGHWRIRRFETQVMPQPQDVEGGSPDTISCVSYQSCGDNYFSFVNVLP